MKHARELLASALKNIRLSRELTQIQFAEILGLNQAKLSQIESGKKGFTSDSLTAYAAALGCEPWELLVDQDKSVKTTRAVATKRQHQLEEFAEAYQAASEVRREVALAILRNDESALSELAKKVSGQ